MMPVPNTVRTIGLILIGLHLVLFPAACSENRSAPNKQGAQEQDNTSGELKEALTILKTRGLFFDLDPLPSVEDAASLNSFLKRYDPSAVYFSQAEFSAFQASQKASYVGIGMEIEKNNGEIICFPLSGSPAQEAGIESGDRIDVIDGRPVAGQSTFAVASWLMGAGGTPVHVWIVKKNGERRLVEIFRKRIQTRSVTIETAANPTIIKIHYFDSGTKRQLQSALKQMQPASELVLDLRDNPGGDLYKSIDAAMLFLGKKALIVSIQSRGTVMPYRSTTAVYCTACPLVIWQNGHTASAAEVFIAALTENHRAVSVGVKSYGKGTTQEVAELSDGSALIFTSGFLQTPKGTIYHQHGLTPTYSLNGDEASGTAFLKETQRIFSEQANRRGSCIP